MKSLLALSLLLSAPATWAKIEVESVVKDGATISGDAVLRARVTSTEPVTQVEFYVNDDLRDTDTSTPYEFRLDTLSENDGPIRITFAAYNSAGQSAKKSVRLTIDNGVSKGAAFHVAAAEDHVANSRWDAAILSGRIALKADEKSNAARMLLARAFQGKGEFDQAQRYAEDVLAAEPGNVAAANLVSTLKVRTAFRTFVREGSSSTSAVEQISNALKGAVQQRRKTVDAGIEAASLGSTEERIAAADAAIRGYRFALALERLQPLQVPQAGNAAVANRIAFAQLRLSRPQAAAQTLLELARRGTPDAVSHALLSLAHAEAGDLAASDASMKEAILADSQNLTVKTAQAFLALKFQRQQGPNGVESLGLNGLAEGSTTQAQAARARATLSGLLSDLANERQQSPEADLFRCALADSVNEYSRAAQYFQDAALADALNPDLYVLRANQLIRAVQERRVNPEATGDAYRLARALLGVALEARESSPEALTGLALSHWLEGDAARAVTLARAATQAGPQYGAAHYTLAGALQSSIQGTLARRQSLRERAGQLASSNPTEAAKLRAEADQLDRDASNLLRESQDLMRKAGEMDRRFLAGREIPKADLAWRYFASGGLTPIVSAPR